MPHIAPIQPTVWISFCRIGANRNWPKEPPALMTPEAVPRASAGMRCAAAPISTEKLAAPDPIADISPIVTTRPRPESMKGVIALPSASSTSAPTSTGPAPWRSATAPATGWIAPQANCATAMARLMVAMPRPVALLSGLTKRPIDWRAPIVTSRMPAAARVVIRTSGERSERNMGARSR